MKPEDRRRRTRVPLQKTIRHTKYQVLGTPVFEENSSIDLSSNGIAFETNQDYKKGTLVLLEVEIERDPVKLLVCVAWVKVVSAKDAAEKRFQIGAELIAIDPEHKKTVQSHLGKMLRTLEMEPAPAKKSKKKSAKKSPKKIARKSVAKKPTAKKSKSKKSTPKKRATKKTRR
jgi:Tfp pilus assembly protein PilZ